MRLLFVISAMTVLSVYSSWAQVKHFNADEKYHPDSLKRWTRSIFGGMSEKHPGFYWYTDKEKFDRLIDSTIQTIQIPSTELEFYRKLKPLFAQIGCVHTSISLSAEYQAYLEKTATFIPVEIFIDSLNDLYVTKTYDSLSNIEAGSKIISINDRPVSIILDELMDAIPSDGYNKTTKVLILNNRFPFWYQTIIEVIEKFKVEFEHGGVAKTVELGGVTKDKFPSLESLEHNYIKPFEFYTRDDIGFLEIHSFAKSAFKKSGQNFRRVARRTFKSIHRSRIQKLVVDVRYNTGGTDGNAALFASYFFDKPFRYWKKIEVTEAVSSEIKGLYRLFYKKPKLVDGSYRWRSSWVTGEFDYYQEQKPAKYNFKGETYMLTDGLCLSSCSDLVAILSYNGKVKVVGQETGGGYQGNNSGMMPVAKIPTGLRIAVPLQKYTNAVDETMNYGRGTMPDFEVVPTFDNWIKKRDAEMETVIRILNLE